MTTAAILRLARIDNGRELLAAMVLLGGFLGMLVGALWPHLAAFTVCAAATYVADWWLHQRGSRLVPLLSRIRVGVSIRFLIRQSLLVLTLSRIGWADSVVFSTGAASFVLFYGLQAPHGAALALIRSRRLPVVTRNIDISTLGVPPAPARFLTRRATEKLLHCDLAAVMGLLLSAATGQPGFGIAGAGVTLLAGIAYVAALLPSLLPSRTPPNTAAVLEFTDTWMREYQPGVVLYFSGSRTSAYQVNMWLDTLSALSSRPVVILRERYLVRQLAPTRVPVLCVPSATHLMSMDLSSVRVALYPANVGKNIHLLRVPTIQHVFIGHGDSDKIASVNPYSKVYDEVWTAGRAGRDRYALADVGVRDEDIVEVGRPQLEGISGTRCAERDAIPTVLYAPTWEGWTDEPGNTSLILAGENIVRALVTAHPEVRLLYKPHPFTGTRSPEAKAAHQRVLAIIEQANNDRAVDQRWREVRERGAGEREAATEALRHLSAKLADLETMIHAHTDEADTPREGAANPLRAEEVAALREEWKDTYWRSREPYRHQVITGPQPHLYDCFNRSDLLISDISSVVSDFVASGKPYAITDTVGLGEEDFKRQNSTARAAFILTPDAAGVPKLLEYVHRGGDPLAQERRVLKRYLLGPQEPPSLQRFDEAVATLAAKAEARLARLAEKGDHEEGQGERPAGLPPQRRGSHSSRPLTTGG